MADPPAVAPVVPPLQVPQAQLQHLPRAGNAGSAPTRADGNATTTTAPAGNAGPIGDNAAGNNATTGQLINRQSGPDNGPSTGATPGTNTAGTAAPSGAPGANAQYTAPAGGIGRPTTTNERDSDAKINQENDKAGKTVGKIRKIAERLRADVDGLRCGARGGSSRRRKEQAEPASLSRAGRGAAGHQ